MFDEETVNAFSGGYKVSESGVVTLFGRPAVSTLKRVIAFPASLSIHSLVRKSESVVWRGTNTVDLPYEISKLSNDWYDPIKMMVNIAIQRGWKYPPYILAEEHLGYQMALGHYSAFIDLLVQAFSTVNEITLSPAEFNQISTEIQGKVKGQTYPYETLARQQGKNNNLLFFESSSNSFRNEIVNLEPFSMFLISENYLGGNQNYANFLRNFKKFSDNSMDNRDPTTLSFPYVGIRNHSVLEEEMYDRTAKAFEENDVDSFIQFLSKYSQSLGYNLGVLSDFQKNIANLLERYKIKNYLFNVGEYSGSVLVFVDSQELATIRDNLIREYYNKTNRTLRFDDLQILNSALREPIRA